jgi:DNA-binding MarR family transcriptional regulator
MAHLIEQLSRAVHAASHSHGLYPAQWSALRFFANSDEKDRTATALARSQGIAFGPVSRTVRTLITKGLINRERGNGDRRVHTLKVSAKGARLLEKDPLDVLISALDRLSTSERRALVVAIEASLRTLLTRGQDIALEPET